MKALVFTNRKIPLLFIILYFIFSTAVAQVTSYPLTPYYIGTNYINANAVITHQGAIIAPADSSSTVDVSGSSIVAFKSGTGVELNPGFTAEPSGSGSFTAEIAPQIDLILISPANAINNGVVNVPKWEKLELGFKLPDEYTVAVNSFFNHYYSGNASVPVNPNTELNPYADDSLRVVFDLVSPTNRHIRKWGFFMREAAFNIHGDHASDTNKLKLGQDTTSSLYPYNWRFRFAPDEEGNWSFNISISNPQNMQGFPAYTFNGFIFYCEPALNHNHGFLKVADNKRNLQFDDGTPFFGIGENIADIEHDKPMSDSWWSANFDGFFKRDFNVYMKTLDEMNSAGANYLRKFLYKTDFPVEFYTMGVYDRYDTIAGCCGQDDEKTKESHSGNLQYNLWAFDRFFDKLKADTIYMQLCVDPYPPGSGYQDFIWGNSAYALYTYDSQRRTDVMKLFSDQKLRYYWKRKYKYIMNRWGYSVNIAALETFNEIDGVMGYNYNADSSFAGACGANWSIEHPEIPELKDTIYNWHTDILGYVKDSLMNNNANKHLTTVSFTDYGVDKPNSSAYYHLFTNPKIDIADIHKYIWWHPVNAYGDAYNLSNDIHSELNIDKPFHIGEFCEHGNMIVPGAGEPWTAQYFNNYDISFHNEIWASAFMGNFTTGLSYEWTVIHWWPDANPWHVSLPLDTIIIDNRLDSINILPMPNQDTIEFTNKKIYHNFKPLSDYIQQAAIDFGDSYFSRKFYDEDINMECYYLTNFDQTKAYGWIHNLNHYWFNKYYYYYLDSSHNYQNLYACDTTDNNFIVLYGFNDHTYYNIDFYYTRSGNPPAYFPQSINGYYTGSFTHIIIGSNVLNYLNCDTNNADFAFKITESENLKMSENTDDTTAYYNKDTLAERNTPDEIVSVHNNENATDNFNINIIPNPSKGEYIVYLSGYNGEERKMDLLIYNNIGEIIYSKSASSPAKIDIQGSPKGIYILKVSIDNSVKYFKLVLQ